jgi:hypothetical protein
MEIKITVEVENADELLILHKGGIFGFFADVVLSKSKKQYKVEKEVCEQIINKLKVELPLRLEEEQVKTKLSFEVGDQQNVAGDPEI